MDSRCSHPFLDESNFPKTGGAVQSRWCEQSGNVSCCLPCPLSHWPWKNVIWLTDDLRIALWPAIPVLILLVWLLLTFAIFPRNLTDRHYLSTSPVLGFIFITIAFIIPSKGHPRECYNQITPNDMQNDARCALMGVSLFFGAWVVILSCFFRSVSLHLHVCWEIKPGQKFKIASLLITFVGAAGLLVLVLLVSGVQYTFGRICYLIPHYDRAAFWGPLLGISIASLILQFGTIIYCVALVIRPFINYQKLRWYGYRPSADDERIIGAQRTASRVRRIVQMQWRAILITVLILIYVIFLAAVLMKLRQFHDYPSEARRMWWDCLAKSKGDKMRCLPLAASLGPREPELWAVLYMLILSGLLAVAILFRPTMLQAWADLLTGKPIRLSSDETSSEHDVEITGRNSTLPASTLPASTLPAFSTVSDSASMTRSQTSPYPMT